MASVAFEMIEEVTAHAQSDSLEDAREICADGTYIPNNLLILYRTGICYNCLPADKPSGSKRVHVEYTVKK